MITELKNRIIFFFINCNIAIFAGQEGITKANGVEVRYETFGNKDDRAFQSYSATLK